jgi:penicillin G amidase
MTFFGSVGNRDEQHKKGSESVAASQSRYVRGSPSIRCRFMSRCLDPLLRTCGHADPAMVSRRLLLAGVLILCGNAASQPRGSVADEARKSLATVSGHLAAPGLSRPVRVLRDRWGVAHIYAQNQHDLFFAQGYVAAQDRLFQMEMWKRAGQGRLSEILGPSAVTRDVDARLLMYRGDMKAEYASYSPQARDILTAFTDGINSYVHSLTAPGGKGLPVEFKIAGFAPDAWHPQDCLNRMAAFSMTGNAVSELAHAQALVELGASKAAKVMDLDPPVALDPAPNLDLNGLEPGLLDNFIGSDQRIVFPAHPIEGSNNWTVAGVHTSTGRPLLANDPHRVVGLPSLRYMVHLVAPGWDVIGAGEPGLPGVALGHNENIAWGFTIFGLDQQDLYVEELNPADPLEYRTETGWRKMESHRETFFIKGARSKDIELKFTRHGPVVWEDGKRALALRWVGSEPGTAGYIASLSIDQAQNWDQFEAAVVRWKLPSENLVYADRYGNIGEHSVGLVPVRRWTGLLPVPGASGYEWKGFVPMADLPHAFNPAAGYIATANHKMIPENYPYNVGFEWDPGYRFNRIGEFFSTAQLQNRKLGMIDMQRLQNDVVSLPAINFQKLLRSTPLRDDPTLSTFLRWDGQLTRESADAALYEVWFRSIGRALAKEISSQNSKTYQDLPPDTLLRLLANPDADFFGANPAAHRDRLLTDTLREATQELERLMGTDRARWQWGTLHQIYFRHGLDQYSTDITKLLNIGPLARPGDGYTINATWVSSDTWDQEDGASYRQILDTSDWDQSVAVNTPGQSGQPASAHYSDLAPLWDMGGYFPLVYSTAAVKNSTSDVLVLEPTR